jgi:hypothetical protein
MSRVTSKKSALTSSSLALLAGVGAMASAGDAVAKAQVLVKTDGDRIFVSQGAGFQELQLGSTPEAAHLRGLLRDAARAGEAVVVPVDPFIVANGGGGADGTKPKSSAASSSGQDGSSKGSDGEQKKDK